MKSEASTVDEYLKSLPDDRKKAVTKLRKVIKENLPKGFEEVMGYGMIGYVVPHSIYPKGYHCNPKLPMPFMNVASQKNYIALYHMGIYSNEKLLNWFVDEYKKVAISKIDMGKGCIRFKKPDEIPFDLIGELTTKISVLQLIETMENNIVNRANEKEKLAAKK